MPFDGIFLSAVLNELVTFYGAKIEKIYQPAPDEISLTLNGAMGTGRVLISANPSAARLHLTDTKRENPPAAPMFCMLLRKNLTGARLCGIRQEGLDRTVAINFDAYNEMGDTVRRTLQVELMGRHSNIILIAEGKIVDSIKRVDFATSSFRQVLPGRQYVLPPAQDKLHPIELDAEMLKTAICKNPDAPLSKILLGLISGLSPLNARELAFRVCHDSDILCGSISAGMLGTLAAETAALGKLIEDRTFVPVLMSNEDGNFDFSYDYIMQYGIAVTCKRCPSFTALLDEYYSTADSRLVLKNRGADLLKLVNTNIERVAKKINLQRADMQENLKKDYCKLYGESIMANIYKIAPSDTALVCQNFYSSENETLEIPLDTSLTPAQNAQKYYKIYRKAKTANEHLSVELQKSERELIYLHSVQDALSRTATGVELNEIRYELYEGGYIKKRAQKSKKTTPIFHQFELPDGTVILAGKNNTQNEYLTTKLARRSDTWLHAKDMPGSHVIIRNGGADIDSDTLILAANIAAHFSAGAASANVPVDCTTVCYVKKVPAAPPGFVTYTNQKTLYVTPDPKLFEAYKK